METQGALELVFARNAFYRRLHFLALAALTLCWLVIVILFAIIYFLVKNPTSPVYFATDTVGKIIEVVPVNEPNMSDAEVAAWAMEAVQATFTYNFYNYQQQMQAAQKYFTNYGWYHYMRSVTQSGNLDALKAHKQIILGQVVDPNPILVTKGVLGGAYAWKFEMRMLMTFWDPPYNDASKILNPWKVTVIVQRQPILQSYKGLGIVQVIAEQAANYSSSLIAPLPTG